jgi:hypothetical protein
MRSIFHIIAISISFILLFLIDRTVWRDFAALYVLHFVFGYLCFYFILFSTRKWIGWFIAVLLTLSVIGYGMSLDLIQVIMFGVGGAYLNFANYIVKRVKPSYSLQRIQSLKITPQQAEDLRNKILRRKTGKKP